MLFIHLNDELSLFLQCFHDIGKTLETDLSFLKIRVLVQDSAFENGRVDAFKTFVLKVFQGRGERLEPVVLIELGSLRIYFVGAQTDEQRRVLRPTGQFFGFGTNEGFYD